MSTKTSHYQLHQWEPSDQFLREDFNADFAKIDAGIQNAYDRAGQVESNLTAQLTSAKNVLNTAIGKKADTTALTALQTVVAGKCEIVAGSYTGNGEYTRTIHLGFTPKAVILENSQGTRPSNCYAGGIALPGHPIYNGTVTIVSDGFVLKQTTSSAQFNALNNVMYYIAFK